MVLSVIWMVEAVVMDGKIVEQPGVVQLEVCYLACQGLFRGCENGDYQVAGKLCYRLHTILSQVVMWVSLC